MTTRDPSPSRSDPSEPSAADTHRDAARAPGASGRRIASSELFGSANELVILHRQREYRLRVTSNGKLILTA